MGTHPLLLYVENATGYTNLCRLLSRKAETGLPNEETAVAARQRAPITPAFLQRQADLLEGLIAVSSDPALERFFPGRFYQAVSRREGVVACPSVHHARPEDRRRYDILQSIRTLSLLEHEHPEKRSGGRYHFRTPSEMAMACSRNPEWIRASQEIAGRCHFELPFGKPRFPAFCTPGGISSTVLLRRLVMDGLKDRYAGRRIVSETGAEVSLSRVQVQIEEELAIIGEVGYEDYFLITWDFLQECRRRGMDWITRGSAADSLVCFCLGISSVCPIRFGLYFRRFLNKDRMALNKLPDIDIDFAHDVKDDVVRLIFEKYGREHCAVVGGFSTFQARSAFAEVAKVMGVGEREVRRFTDHFPWSFGGGWVPDEPPPSGGVALIERLRAAPENRELPLDEEPYRTALETAAFLDGMPRYPKMHPCGLVLSRPPLHELTPTFIAHKGYPTTHFDMDAVEVIGLVKMDILAQGGLAAMRDTRVELAKRNIRVDLDRFQMREAASPESEARNPKEGQISNGESRYPCSSPFDTEAQRFAENGPLVAFRVADSELRKFASPGGGVSGCGFADPAVWRMIAEGGGRAVHHIESPAMISLCRMTNVREIDGLIAIVSVIRPGAANEGKKLAFTRRYQGLEPVTYPHPCLEGCLRSTFGLVVYEEHILQLCEAFAGLPPGRADVLRRALNKQKRDVIQKIRGEFFQSARARGHSAEKVAEVWELVAGFAGYAFCKAHSTAYGVEAYQSAWLKHYFPAEFMAAVLTNGKGFYDPLVYVLECHRLGLKLLPPSINDPGPGFSVRPECGVQSVAGNDSACCHSASDIARPRLIRVPVTRVKGLTTRTSDALLAARQCGRFSSITDFFHRVKPAGEELEAMIRAGAFDEFGETRTRQFWQAQHLLKPLDGKGSSGRPIFWALLSAVIHWSCSRKCAGIRIAR
ncbi:MAG: hypothetical protein MUC91_03180 [Verrucomicrobia bacterium]|nr:hypothetical protein [Verrucomicrobiota bacterium]